MKKKTAMLLVCAICAVSVAVGVAAKGAFREMKRNPKADVERRKDESRGDEKVSDTVREDTKRPELNKEDTSELITEEKAKGIAFSRSGVKESEVKRIKAELDFDDGLWKYEVDFKHNGFEYEVDIDAKNGNVIKFEKEYDD